MHFARITHSVWEWMLDRIFPPSKRLTEVRALTIQLLPIDIRTHTLLGRSITSLASYKNTDVKNAIRVLKYEKSMHAARLFGELLSEYLLPMLAEESLLSAREVVLVPMPLGNKRLRERGYNQVTQVLSTLSEYGIELPVREDLLKRTRETRPQTTLSRKGRLENVDGAFEAPPGLSLSNFHILLIDDVTTTGATLHHAALALERAGAKVTCLALTHA